MVDLFLLPKDKTWMNLSSWVHVGEYEDLTAAQEAAKMKMEAEPDKWGDFEIQGKMVLN